MVNLYSYFQDIRVSIAIIQADEIEKLFCHKFPGFMMKRTEKPDFVKTYLRDMIIVPEMIGNYLEEFSITYKPIKHLA